MNLIQGSRLTDEEYRQIFEFHPSSMWVIDFGAVFQSFQILSRQVDEPLPQYLAKHRHKLNKLGSLVRVVDVNQTALTVFDASSKQELMSGVARLMVRKSYRTFVEVMEKILSGEVHIECLTEGRTLNGRRLALKCNVYYQDLSRQQLIVGLQDVTHEMELEKRERTILAHHRLVIELTQFAEQNVSLETIISHVGQELKYQHDLILSDVTFLEETEEGSYFRYMHSALEDTLVGKVTRTLGFDLKGSTWPIRSGSRFSSFFDPPSPIHLAGGEAINEFMESALTTRSKMLKTVGRKVISKLNLNAMVILPLQRDGSAIGTLTLGGSRPISQNILDSLMIVADKLSDILERYLIRDALRSANKRNRVIVNALPDLVIQQRSDGVYLDFAGNNPDIMLKPKDEMIGKKPDEIGIPKFLADLNISAMKEALSTGEVVEYDYELDVPQVGHRYFNTRIIAISEDEVLHVIRDTSEQKKAQLDLDASRQRLSFHVEHTPVGIIEWAVNGEVVNWNPAAERIFGFSPDEAIGKKARDLILAPSMTDKIEAIHQSVVKRGSGQHSRNENVTKDGRTIVCEWHNTPLKHADGQILGVASMVWDVTDEIKAQQRVEQDLAEKKVLLQEIHHRVKNNLQVIISLLKLKGSNLSSPELKTVFDDCISRIHSLAMVHKQLYESTDLSRIAFDTYTSTLLDELGAVHHCDGRIRLEKDLVPLALPIDRAIPLGLILNESVTNAFKHAFPGERCGRIRVTLTNIDGQAGLVIEDDGIGFNTDSNTTAPGSLGLELIQLLVAQIGGTHQLTSDENGTRLEIRFA